MPPSSSQHWTVRYDIIVQGLDQSLRNSLAVRAHLEGLSSDDVSLKFQCLLLCSSHVSYAFFLTSCIL